MEIDGEAAFAPARAEAATSTGAGRERRPVVVFLSSWRALMWVYGAVAASVDIAQVVVVREEGRLSAEEAMAATRLLVSCRTGAVPGSMAAEALRDLMYLRRSPRSLRA